MRLNPNGDGGAAARESSFGNLDLREILARNGRAPSRILPILHDVMAALGWVPPHVITELAQELGVSRGQVEGVVGFYSFFSDEPRGRYRVLFSDNITDQMSGSLALRRRMLDAFHVAPFEVAGNGLVSIGTTSCTGLCDQGPALLVNGRAIARLTPARIGAIVSLIRSEIPMERWPSDLFRIDSHIRRRDLLLSAELEPGSALDAAIARGRAGTIAELSASGLRGRGGAGFVAGTKWAACASATGPERYVVCNADEGEPGTFKDRDLLLYYADAVLEGMTIAGFAIDSAKGFLYLRGEYGFLREHLNERIAARRDAGLLGSGIRGAFDFDVEVVLGAGAYVCGEESALLESIEGKRGIPRNRPPYPVTHGYMQKPTLVNNVETLLAAVMVSMHGASWLRSVGTSASVGTKILSVSGDVANPGVYEFPFGVSVRQVLEEAGAKDAVAAQVGGAAGFLISASEFDRSVAFEDVPSAGAVMVFDASRDMLEVLDNFVRFFAHESCGFCTPCRVGTTLNAQTLSRIVQGKGSKRDLVDLDSVSRLMRAASHCGLGVTAARPVLDALAKFRPLFERRARALEVLPTFDLDEALAAAREVTARDDADAHFSEEER